MRHRLSLHQLNSLSPRDYLEKTGGCLQMGTQESHFP